MAAPHYASGKICYLEIPATDIQRSADFYQQAFGWNVRTRDDGSVAFDDSVGEVSGSWVKGTPPHEPGILIHIMVGDARAAVDAVKKAGGEIVEDVNDSRGEILATFRDPGGNILSIYQEPALARAEGTTS